MWTERCPSHPLLPKTSGGEPSQVWTHLSQLLCAKFCVCGKHLLHRGRVPIKTQTASPGRPHDSCPHSLLCKLTDSHPQLYPGSKLSNICTHGLDLSLPSFSGITSRAASFFMKIPEDIGPLKDLEVRCDIFQPGATGLVLET